MNLFNNRGTKASNCFNDYQEWFVGLDETNAAVVIDLGSIIIRAFGAEAEKQRQWDEIWRTKYPEWGPAAAGVTVSSQPREIWCDLRQDKYGNLILPPHILGHEMIHTLRLQDARIADPDTFIKDIY